MIHELGIELYTINSLIADNKCYVFLNPKVATKKNYLIFFIHKVHKIHILIDNHSSVLYVPDLSNLLITHII